MMSLGQLCGRALALGVAAASIAVALPARAHDVWIQPFDFWAPRDASVMTTLQVGHGQFRQRWNVDAGRVLVFRSVGPGGASTDHRGELGRGPMNQDHTVRFAGAGTHVLMLQSAYSESVLPGLRFTEYLKEEGLTPALRQREATGAQDKPGRELYSRRGKALVQVGPPSTTAQPWVTQPVGLSLEIVPQVNPYVAGADGVIPVQVLFEGRPLAGGTVMLNNLDFDGRPVSTQVTDAAGRAVFKVPRVGSWQLNVLWTKPLKGNPRGDFETTFSSLTFGFPRTTAAR